LIKALQELCQSPLYKSAKFSIRPNWLIFNGINKYKWNHKVGKKHKLWKFGNNKTEHILKSN
jgi:hypothetical protein